MSRRARLLRTGVAAAVLAAGGVAAASLIGEEPPPTAAEKLAETPSRRFTTNDPIERACALDKKLLARVWRGYDPAHSEDVTMVPLAPNYSGAFTVTSHSGPWDYLQNVPLVLYGPGWIRASKEPIETPATIADVYPTVGRLLEVDLPAREGTALEEALRTGSPGVPKLVLLIMWDGVGRNVLERWPDSWPNLARLERQGTSYVNAVVGSSPSITPATHSTVGTGVFPRTHGVTAINYRSDNGNVRTAFANRDPSDLQVTTYGDEIDLAFGNAPQVGMLAWKSWHLGMLGHGSMTPGGDNDQLAIMSGDDEITGNDLYYETPSYLESFEALDERISELDRSDGKADGEWLGHGIRELHDNPAWVNYETDALLTMLRREGYGADEVPDLFFTNYKPTDIVGHQYTMDSQEMAAVLHAQDAALGRILEYLDEEVGDYVVILSADHGHTPSPERSGAWPILQGQLEEDLNAHFGVPDGQSLVESPNPVGPFLDKELMRELGVSGAAVAEFLNGYTIEENWNEDELPEGYEDRAEEPIIAAAWSQHQWPDVMQCAFGARRPPKEVGY